MRNRLMIKEFFLTLVLFSSVIVMLIYPHSAAAISLKSNSIINEDSIKLSDIFAGLPEYQDKVLGPAPLPGQDMVLNARTLMRIAVALDLPWRPQDAGQHVVLSRAASVVNFSMIEDALKDEISSQGVSGSFDIAFLGPLSEIVLPQDKAASVEVQSLNFRNGKDRFEATLVAPSRDMPLKTIHVSGAVKRLIDVPVLRSTLQQGSIISRHDIEMVSMRESDLDDDMVLSADGVVGMTPRRMIVQGKPLKISELEAPQVVGRGDLVVMFVNHRGMKLTTQAKALEDGAKGDVIRVSNVSSSKTMNAVITGQREVQVIE